MNEFDSVRKNLPEKGWLAHVVSFTDNMEACPRFRFFSAACVLGAAVNNKVFIYRGDPDLLPKLFGNIWVLLLAPPGRGHKTSTINMACNIMAEAMGNEVRILADKITPESLVKSLSEPQSDRDIIRIGPGDATGLIKAPELSVFFGRQQYNVGLVSLITDLYDFRARWVSHTIGRGRDSLKNVCISILGGSTPTWLQTMLPEDAFTGGFMSRFVLCEMPPAYVKRVPFPSKPEGSALSAIIKELATIARLKGEMCWTKESQDLYQKICESMTPTGDIQKDAYRERETEQVLKLALLLALSNKSLVLEAEYLYDADKILHSLEVETMPRIERMTTHPKQRILQEMVDILRLSGPMTKPELFKQMVRRLPGPVYGTQEFNGSVSILLDIGDIVREQREGETILKAKGGDTDDSVGGSSKKKGLRRRDVNAS